MSEKPNEARTPAPEGEVVCSGCEGRPVFPNVPCAVCGASPVVPVGVSREEIIKAVRPVLDRPPMIDSSQSHKLDIQAGRVADAILAALGTTATDTGREG